jgi:hypothetical protein
MTCAPSAWAGWRGRTICGEPGRWVRYFRKFRTLRLSANKRMRRPVKDMFDENSEAAVDQMFRERVARL